MRSAWVIFLSVLCVTPLMAQSADANLASDLEAIHAKWFKAFDSGDGATMDQVELDKLVFVMPTGSIWSKSKPRAREHANGHPLTERTLSNVSVWRWGDTAIPTGILTTKSGKEKLRRGHDGSVCKQFWQLENSFSAMEPSYTS